MKNIYLLGIIAALLITTGAGCSKGSEPLKEVEIINESETQDVATSTEEIINTATSTEEQTEQPGTVHIDLQKESTVPKTIAKASNRTDSYGCPYEK